MHRRSGVVGSVCFLLAARVAAAGALDVHDPAPRNVFFEVEISSAPNDVGQVFGSAHPAAWSASGNIGTLTISAETHELLRSGGGWTPVPVLRRHCCHAVVRRPRP